MLMMLEPKCLSPSLFFYILSMCRIKCKNLVPVRLGLGRLGVLAFQCSVAWDLGLMRSGTLQTEDFLHRESKIMPTTGKYCQKLKSEGNPKSQEESPDTKA